MNSVAYFEIQSDNPAKSAEFYGSIFGWTCTRAPEMPIEYWRVETAGIRGGILKRPAKIPPPQSGTNAFCCSMEVKNFDSVATQILDRGGQVALPKFAVPGVCWQGYFIDPDGNTFGLFQADSKAK